MSLTKFPCRSGTTGATTDLIPNDPEHHFGLVRNTYQAGRDQVYEPKPAYRAAKTLSEFFNGYVFEQRLAVGGADDYVLVFAKGGDRRIAAWTTSSSAHRVNIPLVFPCTRVNSKSSGIPAKAPAQLQPAHKESQSKFRPSLFTSKSNTSGHPAPFGFHTHFPSADALAYGFSTQHSRAESLAFTFCKRKLLVCAQAETLLSMAHRLPDRIGIPGDVLEGGKW